MLSFLLKRTPLKRLARGVPVLGLLSAAQVALLAKDHLFRLDGAQRRRLLELLRQARGRPGSLNETEHRELDSLVAALEPRLFAGSAAERFSPVPIPKRVLYGPARDAHAEKQLSISDDDRR
jgi:hypothetical protein